jgi:hypothetical protein
MNRERLFEEVLREDDDNEPVDMLALELELALKKIYDNTKTEGQGNWRHITCVKGPTFGLSTYGDITGVDFSIKCPYESCVTIDFKLIRMAPQDEGKGLARETVDIIVSTCDHFNEDEEITINLEDWSEGFWDHIIEDYDTVSWNVTEAR